jgi:small subunit ribosomal protein S16
VRTGDAGHAMSPVEYQREDSTMAVKIRLRRVGRKKSPMYRIVVADSKSPRDGKFIEIVGQYQPRTGDQALNLDAERVNYWLNVGAQPTDTVRSLLRKAGVLKQRHESRLAEKLQANAVPVSTRDEA